MVAAGFAEVPAVDLQRAKTEDKTAVFAATMAFDTTVAGGNGVFAGEIFSFINDGI